MRLFSSPVTVIAPTVWVVPFLKVYIAPAPVAVKDVKVLFALNTALAVVSNAPKVFVPSNVVTAVAVTVFSKILSLANADTPARVTVPLKVFWFAKEAAPAIEIFRLKVPFPVAEQVTFPAVTLPVQVTVPAPERVSSAPFV